MYIGILEYIRSFYLDTNKTSTIRNTYLPGRNYDGGNRYIGFYFRQMENADMGFTC